MNGICAIYYTDGWAISNEVIFDADKRLIDINGEKISKHIFTLKVLSIFDCINEITVNKQVECIFKTDEGKKHAFIGTIKSRGKQVTIIHELIKSDRYNEILNKIKKWQTQQAYQAD